MTDSTSAVLSLQNVSVTFGTQTVLDHVSVNIGRNETVCIIGESGCGKTVLLKLLVGLLNPTSGVVNFEGHSVSQLNANELTAMRQRVGFLFQQAALFDSLTVFDNVAFGLRSKGGVPESEIRIRVTARVKEVGLPESSLAKMPSDLSGGMRKRVGLARALALDPDVMLYDEPTTGLDPIMTDVVNELILSVRRRRPVTSIIVTHEMRTVQKVADRVVMLYPRSRLQPGESQVIYDGAAAGLASCGDERVRQFVAGDAGSRVKGEE